eukprot:maker-scaffold125_size330479-snap-gene-0.14 protein:Tk06882 transcript:maker-scaffold125_size330479-snap-gene-0.14-mRNA-1 annotation:"innexin inx2-like"
MSFLFFKSFADLIKGDTTRIDNGWFLLHYRMSFVIMAVSSVLIGATQYFGDPITCHGSNLPKDITNTYCWIHGTWTIKEYLEASKLSELAHPGVGPYDERIHEKVSHRYYQWVPIVLGLSALLFYVPRGLWKLLEGGWVENMSQGMKFPHDDPSVREKRVNFLYYFYSRNKRKHRTYAFLFAFCESLNLLNIICQWIMADLFMSGMFRDYGSNVVHYYRFESGLSDSHNPCDLVFPKVAHCTIRHYGRSGDVQKTEPFCILSQNIVNEKVALIIWFWFVILLVCSTLAMMLRMVVMMVPVARKPILFLYSENNNSSEMSMVCDNCGYGDWFILRQIKKNVDVMTFTTLISVLAKETERQIADFHNRDAKIEAGRGEPETKEPKQPDSRDEDLEDCKAKFSQELSDLLSGPPHK